jgi:hypothetical protein
MPDAIRRLLDDAGRVVAASAEERARLWRRLEKTGSRRRRRWRALSATADVLALALLGVVLARQPPRARPATSPLAATQAAAPTPTQTSLTLRDGVVVALAPGSELHLLPEAAGVAFELRGGHATVKWPTTRSPLNIVVLAGRTRVAGVARRFDVEVSAMVTTLRVVDGKLALEAGGRVITLGPGESARSDDPRLAPLRPSTAPAAPAASAARVPAAASHSLAPTRAAQFEACAAQADPRVARACYQGLVAADDLVAADALFALGSLAQGRLHLPQDALGFWRDYLARFPSGALAPEAALGAIDVCVALGRNDEARTRIAEFLASHPQHPGAPRLRALRDRFR